MYLKLSFLKIIASFIVDFCYDFYMLYKRLRSGQSVLQLKQLTYYIYLFPTNNRLDVGHLIVMMYYIFI